MSVRPERIPVIFILFSLVDLLDFRGQGIDLLLIESFYTCKCDQNILCSADQIAVCFDVPMLCILLVFENESNFMAMISVLKLKETMEGNYQQSQSI